MTDDEPEPEPEERSDDRPEATSDTDDNPSVEGDELADLGSVAEEIEEASQKRQEAEGSEEEAAGSDENDQDDPPERDVDPGGSEISLGTVYTNALGMSAAVARGRYGSIEDDERDRVADEYANMARQIQLDEYLDQWVQTQGGLDGLSPGEAVLLGTLMWGGMVMLDDPTMAENVLDEVRA